MFYLYYSDDFFRVEVDFMQLCDLKSVYFFVQGCVIYVDCGFQWKNKLVDMFVYMIVLFYVFNGCWQCGCVKEWKNNICFVDDIVIYV